MKLWEQDPNQTSCQSPIRPGLVPATALGVPAAQHRDNTHSLGNERECTDLVMRKKSLPDAPLPTTLFNGASSLGGVDTVEIIPQGKIC